MSTKTIVELIDDIDGTTAAETVRFSMDGKSYEIDLSEENARTLRSLLSPWIEHGRKDVLAGSAPSRARRGNYDPARVRAWARSQGITVSERGRIGAGILQAYRAGHSV